MRLLHIKSSTNKANNFTDKEDEIGEIKKIESTFSFKVKRINQKSRLFNKELGGGAILDVGCYQ